MKKIWEHIDINDLEKAISKFVIITYWGNGRNFLLAKVISKTQINEISESNTEKIDLANLKSYFFNHEAYSIKRKLIFKGKELQINVGNTMPAMVSDIKIIDNTIIEEMIKEKIQKEKESVKKMRNNINNLKKNMKKLGFTC